MAAHPAFGARSRSGQHGDEPAGEYANTATDAADATSRSISRPPVLSAPITATRLPAGSKSRLGVAE
ncbi:hypothetical protein I553_4368 [Mycobacterium xenopi 4042]|uniref:Uncharacterized protein n=1 Tax=Mycobacterium xenopi 4042 TaxID=1299334 RepID=X8ADU8_MYCXE|nr:hypothetical protein I553_4368 [Mycobacterium xenopi 4042]